MTPFKSLVLNKETDTHFICRCPFCGDSDNRHHAHLYISKRIPVFKCFKCNTQGHVRLIEELIKESCSYEYSSTIQYNLSNLDVMIALDEIESLIESYSSYITNDELMYFKERSQLKNISLKTIKKFSIFPDSIARNYLYNIDKTKYRILEGCNDSKRLWTIKGLGSSISGRSLDTNSQIRYVIGEYQEYLWNHYLTTDCYLVRSKLIQNYNSLRHPKNLICCEGVYDCVSIYLNRKKFNISDLDSIFVAVQSSDYSRAIKFFKTLYSSYPKEVQVFADIDRTVSTLKRLFNKYIDKTHIVVNWPYVKDWNPISSIRCSLELTR